MKKIVSTMSMRITERGYPARGHKPIQNATYSDIALAMLAFAMSARSLIPTYLHQPRRRPKARKTTSLMRSTHGNESRNTLFSLVSSEKSSLSPNAVKYVAITRKDWTRTISNLRCCKKEGKAELLSIWEFTGWGLLATRKKRRS